MCVRVSERERERGKERGGGEENERERARKTGGGAEKSFACILHADFVCMQQKEPYGQSRNGIRDSDSGFRRVMSAETRTQLAHHGSDYWCRLLFSMSCPLCILVLTAAKTRPDKRRKVCLQ